MSKSALQGFLLGSYVGVLIVLLVACGNDTTTPGGSDSEDVNNSPTPTSKTLIGVANPWNGQTGVVKAETFELGRAPTEVASGPISTTGAFSLELPAKIGIDVPYTTDNTNFCQKLVYATDKGRVASQVTLTKSPIDLAEISSLTVYSSAGNDIGSIHYGNSTTAVSQVYSATDVTISGSCTVTPELSSADAPVDAFTTTVQLDLKAGWNDVTFTFPPMIGDYPVNVVTGALPEDVSWQYIEAEPANLPSFVLPAPDTSRYNITLRFVTDGFTQEQRAVVKRVADRWAAIVTRDVADIEDFVLPEGYVLANAGQAEGTLDDLLIDIAASNLGGADGPLGSGGPAIVRDGPDAPLPMYGTLELNTAELGENGSLNDLQHFEDIVLHEMGHILGIGTIWEDTNNTVGIINPGDPGYPDGPPNVPPGAPNPDYDPRFTGVLAVKEYQKLLASAGRTREATVPITNEGGLNDSGHWRELTFDNEVMTPYLSETQLLSRMTAGSLGDLGYSVNLDSTAIDQDYALPFTASFVQLEPNRVAYEANKDFLRFSDSVGRAQALVQAVDLDLRIGNRSTSGCEPEDFRRFVAGNIALLQRGDCGSQEKVANAKAAGATGVVMMSQGDTQKPSRTGIATGGVGRAKLPAIGISYDLGVKLADLANTGTLIVAVDTPTPAAKHETQTLNPSKYRPVLKEMILKPISKVSPNGVITPLKRNRLPRR